MLASSQTIDRLPWLITRNGLYQGPTKFKTWNGKQLRKTLLIMIGEADKELQIICKITNNLDL